MGQWQFPLLRSRYNLRRGGGGVALGTRGSAATYHMGSRTDLPVALIDGHIGCEFLPKRAQFKK